MALILIDPVALHAAAQQHRKVADTVEHVVDMMGDMCGQLNASWDGGASEQAYAELKRMAHQIADIGRAPHVASGFLTSVADAFEALDAGGGISGAIGVMPMGLASAVAPIAQIVLGLRGNVLRIDPDGVRVVAARGMEASEILSQAAAELQSSSKQLLSRWEGNSARKFAESSEDMVRGLFRAADCVEEFSNDLIKAASRYEELDNSL